MWNSFVRGAGTLLVIVGLATLVGCIALQQSISDETTTFMLISAAGCLLAGGVMLAGKGK